MGRNLVKFLKILMTSSLIRRNCHFDVVTTREVESLHCFSVFGLIKL